MTSASEALLAAAAAALRAIGGLGVYDGAPVRAAFPHALIEIGPESDWGHKSGEGREIRLATVLKDAGERPARLRALTGEAEAALAGLPPQLEGWRLVTMTLLRGQLVRDKAAWAGMIEFRARMLREE